MERVSKVITVRRRTTQRRIEPTLRRKVSQRVAMDRGSWARSPQDGRATLLQALPIYIACAIGHGFVLLNGAQLSWVPGSGPRRGSSSREG